MRRNSKWWDAVAEAATRASVLIGSVAVAEAEMEQAPPDEVRDLKIFHERSVAQLRTAEEVFDALIRSASSKANRVEAPEVSG